VRNQKKMMIKFLPLFLVASTFILDGNTVAADASCLLSPAPYPYIGAGDYNTWAPYGTYQMASMTAYNAWAQDADRSYDFAVVKYHLSSGRYVGDRVGYAGSTTFP
jgi:hypothetical protein